jgi:hypothetical protein
MIQKMSDQHKIKTIPLFGKEEATKETIVKVDNKIIKDSLYESKSKKMDNSEAINHRGSGVILSTGGGKIKDTGGPNKYIGSETNNSIWDSSVIEKLIQKKDNGEKIKETNNDIQKVRNSIKQESLDHLAESLRETDTRKNSTITSVGEYSGGTYKSSKSNISIFDNEAFGRLSEKSEGEKLSDEINKPKQKDESWKNNFGTKKTSNLINSLFDNPSSKENEK